MNDDVSRRTALGRLAALPILPAALSLPILGAVEAPAPDAPTTPLAESSAGAPYVPKFFTAAEWRTLRVLVDDIIPRDARSGSATDAGVPEYIDFTMTDQPSARTPVRGGLAWLDGESRRRFDKPYAQLAVAQRHEILDDIAYPARAPQRLAQGVAFFNRMRDLTASGFYSSKMGSEDLRYAGGAQPTWNGAPPEIQAKLGVRLEDF